MSATDHHFDVPFFDHKAAVEAERDAAVAERDELRRERDRFSEVLEAIALHHAMPAGESWEAAYNEVCGMAYGALLDHLVQEPPKEATG